MRNFKLSSAQIIGREHIFKRINCQDKYCAGSINNNEYIFGIIADGCSEGRSSEVGAVLVSTYACKQIAFYLENDFELANIPDNLFTDIKSYLEVLTNITIPYDNHEEKIDFIKNNLLCTIVGFIISSKKGLYFHYGDGKIIINDRIITIDQNNCPTYIAYHIIDPKYLNDNILPDAFNVEPLDMANLEKFAIASDGFEDCLYRDIWGLNNPRGLQRKFNVWSEQDKHFSDDATIITVEINGEE